MGHYELLAITKTEEDIKEVRETVSALGGKVLKEDAWGMRRLAYPIKRIITGYYDIFGIELASSKVKDLKRKLQLNETVLRGLVFNEEV